MQRVRVTVISGTLILVLVLSLYLASFEGNTPPPVAGEPSSVSMVSLTEVERKAVEGYRVVFDWIYSQDPALNDGIEIIAVDTAGMIGMTENVRQVLLGELAVYGCEVVEKSYQQLKDEGYLTAGGVGLPEQFENGILVMIQDRPADGEDLVFDVEKWRGPLGAVMVSDVTLSWSGDGWKVSGTGPVAMA